MLRPLQIANARVQLYRNVGLVCVYHLYVTDHCENGQPHFFPSSGSARRDPIWGERVQEIEAEGNARKREIRTRLAKIIGSLHTMQISPQK